MSPLVALRVFLRTFLIQATWNVERWQNVGVYFAALPALEVLHPDRKALVRAATRHLAPFNCHPYLASAVIGASLRFEAGREPGADAERADALRATLAAPFAAIGDTFFWGVLRPFCGLLGALACLHGHTWGPLLFLGLYNAAHLPLRALGFHVGLTRGDGVIEAVRRLSLLRVAAVQRLAAAVFLALLVARTPLPATGVAPGLPLAFVALAVALAGAALLRRGMSPLLLVYVVAAGALGVGVATSRF
jgi:PTS system mannose-specific IID component